MANVGTRDYFLSDIPLDKAQQIFMARDVTLGGDSGNFIERIKIHDSVNRVLSENVFAEFSSPSVNTAAMDGISIHSSHSVGANETNPMILDLHKTFHWVDTGDPIPEGCDAVIMIEEVSIVTRDKVSIMSPIAPYEHVRRLAEDIAAPELLLPIGSTIRPLDLACFAASGIADVAVSLKPKIALIPTGNELIKIGQKPGPGEVVEFNSLVLSGLLKEYGAQPHVVDAVGDNLIKLSSAITDLTVENDVVIVIAGSSAGSEDFTAEAIRRSGEILVHGVAIRPGHPVILGIVNETPIIGIPGFPSSAAMTADLFIRPLVSHMLGKRTFGEETLNAIIARKITSPLGEEEFVRVNLARIGDHYVANPTARGASLTLAMSKCDGIARIPSSTDGVPEGHVLSVDLLRSRSEIQNTIIISGSDDIALRLLDTEISKNSNIRIICSSVGSVGGLLALGKGYAHMAGSHLLDPETGEYNSGAVSRFLPQLPVHIIDFVGRTQGLIVPKGNPRNLEGVEDLLKSGVRFINRQKGSGTRLFTDYLISEFNLDSTAILGYQVEEYTHWAIAAAVESGDADVGVGIKAAAMSSSLDFIPLGEEKYQLVVPSIYVKDSEWFSIIMDVLKGSTLSDQIKCLGGYDVSNMGKVDAVIG